MPVVCVCVCVYVNLMKNEWKWCCCCCWRRRGSSIYSLFNRTQVKEKEEKIYANWEFRNCTKNKYSNIIFLIFSINKSFLFYLNSMCASPRVKSSSSSSLYFTPINKINRGKNKIKINSNPVKQKKKIHLHDWYLFIYLGKCKKIKKQKED